MRCLEYLLRDTPGRFGWAGQTRERGLAFVFPIGILAKLEVDASEA